MIIYTYLTITILGLYILIKVKIRESGRVQETDTCTILQRPNEGSNTIISVVIIWIRYFYTLNRKK